jgi:hypothetical protein
MQNRHPHNNQAEDIDALVEGTPLLAEKFFSVNQQPKPLLKPILHEAINFLDAHLVHFILKKGANPNILNSYGQSTLEILLSTLGAKIVNFYDNSQGMLNDKEITQAEKILDLLLCFGLNCNKIILTQPFLQKLNEIKINHLSSIIADEEDHYWLLGDMLGRLESPQHKKQSGYKRTKDTYEIKRDIKIVKNEFELTSTYNKYLKNWFQSTSTIFETIKTSSVTIQSEKNALLTKVTQDIAESINPTLSIPFVFLILEYAQMEFKVGMHIAEIRSKKSNITNFWLTTPDIYSIRVEKHKNSYLYVSTIKSIFSAIYKADAPGLNSLYNIMTEYAMDDELAGSKPDIGY